MVPFYRVAVLVCFLFFMASTASAQPCDVTVTIGNGSGEPGETGVSVQVSLQTDAALSQLTFEVHDVPDLLTARGCNSVIPGLTCCVTDSGVALVELSSASATAGPGSDFVVLDLFFDVDPNAALGAVSLTPMLISATDDNQQSCTVNGVGGSFGVSSCGNGVVDALEECDDGNSVDGDCCSSTCTLEPVGGTCDDGLFCTVGETCSASGVCEGTFRDCGDGIPCTDDSCDESSDQCRNIADDTECDNGLICDGIETCSTIVGCVSGTPLDCSDGVDCTADVCNEPTGCAQVPDDNFCDNGLFCDGAETCDALLDCQTGTPVVCDDGDICTADSCSESSASCLFEPCDNGLVCDGTEVCTPGGCELGTPPDCDDGIACTNDACTEPAGCVQTPVNALCDDGVFCDGQETCEPGVGCQESLPVDCDDGDVCTDDSCSEALASCVFDVDVSNDPICVCDNGVGVDCNDQCIDAVAIGPLPALVSGSTTGATIDAGFPECNGVSPSASGVWYSVTGTGNDIIATTCDLETLPGSASFNTKISVYCLGCDGDGPVCVAANDDAVCGTSLTSTVQWASQLGNDYLILVHGTGPQTGAFDLSVFEGGPAGNFVDCNPPVVIGNDDCPDAISIGPLPALVSGSTTGATLDTNAPVCDGATITAPGVWYSMTGTGNDLVATTCELQTPPGSATFDTKISVYCLGCDGDGPVCIVGNDDEADGSCGFNFHSTAEWTSQAGAEYLILVHGFGTSTGSFEMSVFEGGAGNDLVSCAPPEAVGACCVTISQEPFVAECTQLTNSVCTASGGIFRGAETQCFNPSGEFPSVASTPGLPIPDGIGPQPPLIDTITVDAPGCLIGDLSVDVLIDHSGIGDLRIDLIGPTGLVSNLFDERCGTTDNIDSSFSDDGTTTACTELAAMGVGDAAPLLTGLGPAFSQYREMDASGTWTLAVFDTFCFPGSGDSAPAEGPVATGNLMGGVDPDIVAATSSGAFYAQGVTPCTDTGTLELWRVNIECVEQICEPPLLVTLESFTAERSRWGTDLRWVTTSEVDNFGFRILRARDGEEPVVITPQLIPALGTELSGAVYKFRDEERLPPGIVTYYLEDIDVFGRTTRAGGPVVVEIVSPIGSRRQ